MLSGGERQRVLVARGLLKKDAQIFLFDEATSNLDPKTEKSMTQQLQEMLKGKTVIYCAHRLSSIMGVEKIHVLADGKVQEEGTHQELMESRGHIPYPDEEDGPSDKDKGGKYYQQMWENFMTE